MSEMHLVVGMLRLVAVSMWVATHKIAALEAAALEVSSSIGATSPAGTRGKVGQTRLAHVRYVRAGQHMHFCILLRDLGTQPGDFIIHWV